MVDPAGVDRDLVPVTDRIEAGSRSMARRCWQLRCGIVERTQQVSEIAGDLAGLGRRGQTQGENRDRQTDQLAVKQENPIQHGSTTLSASRRAPQEPAIAIVPILLLLNKNVVVTAQ